MRNADPTLSQVPLIRSNLIVHRERLWEGKGPVVSVIIVEERVKVKVVEHVTAVNRICQLHARTHIKHAAKGVIHGHVLVRVVVLRSHWRSWRSTGCSRRRSRGRCCGRLVVPSLSVLEVGVGVDGSCGRRRLLLVIVVTRGSSTRIVEVGIRLLLSSSTLVLGRLGFLLLGCCLVSLTRGRGSSRWLLRRSCRPVVGVRRWCLRRRH